ncbi:MAG: Yip1 family protein [candidate division WOR-3 bacterium]
MEKAPNIFDKISGVLSKPEGFFNYVKNEQGIQNAFLFFALVSLVNLVGNFILSFILPEAYTITQIISGYIGSLILIFVLALVFHLFLKMFGGKASYEATFRAYAYAMTPTLLFGWIPFFGVLALLYTIYLVTKGFSIVHEIGMGAAFFAFILPIVILIILIVLLLGFAILGFFAGQYANMADEVSETTGLLTRILRKS